MRLAFAQESCRIPVTCHEALPPATPNWLLATSREVYTGAQQPMQVG
jgi:hypothetical protein